MVLAPEITIDAFFAGHEQSRPLFEAVRSVIEEVGPAAVRATKSQIAFRRRIAFAWVWTPDRHLGAGHAPLVLTVDLHRRDRSPRWKQVVEPRPGRFSHHLELSDVSQLDDEVCAWLAEAWAAAG